LFAHDLFGVALQLSTVTGLSPNRLRAVSVGRHRRALPTREPPMTIRIAPMSRRRFLWSVKLEPKV